ncbi:unnamed protein product, partial [marine sediment metagenome]
ELPHAAKTKFLKTAKQILETEQPKKILNKTD